MCVRLGRWMHASLACCRVFAVHTAAVDKPTWGHKLSPGAHSCTARHTTAAELLPLLPHSQEGELLPQLQLLAHADELGHVEPRGEELEVLHQPLLRGGWVVGVKGAGAIRVGGSWGSAAIEAAHTTATPPCAASTTPCIACSSAFVPFPRPLTGRYLAYSTPSSVKMPMWARSKPAPKRTGQEA